MHVRPIRTDKDHAAALKEIERLWGAGPGTPEGDTLDVLTVLVDDYENSRWPFKALDPVDTIKAHMEATGRSRADLAKVIGSRPRASEIMSRKRALTINMVRNLAREWNLPPELLIGPYKLRKRPSGGSRGQAKVSRSKRARTARRQAFAGKRAVT